MPAPGWHLDAARRRPKRDRKLDVQPWWPDAAVLYAAGKTMTAVGRQLNVTAGQVRTALMQMGVIAKPKPRRPG